MIILYLLLLLKYEPKLYNTNEVKQPGLYFVETSNYVPMRGNGWYSQPMIEYCLNEKIITDGDIKYVLFSSLTIPANYYNDFVDYIYNLFEAKESKLAINSMIGMFKPKDREVWKSILVPSTTFQHYLKQHHHQ